jgi:XTP/dITP diphosphohydrolase
MKKLLIGTTNPAKFDEYKFLLSSHAFDFLSVKDLGIKPPPEEGKTFEENAIFKAKYYYNRTGIPSVSDDAGFEVDFLNGEPGILSRRWTGKEMTDEEMIKEVINRMKGVPKQKRSCRLIAVIAVGTPFGIATADASIEGVLAEKPSPKRIEGYPFRSVMFLPNYGKYFCDLDDGEMEIMNHRKAALEKINDLFFELSKE